MSYQKSTRNNGKNGIKMENFEDSWKNEKVFKKQLELNSKELSNSYPSHWNIILFFINELKKDQDIRNILDIGCGCGSLAAVLRKHYPEIRYTGIDYAKEAILIARNQWPFARFFHKDYKDLLKKDIERYDIINACSLHNVLPDGDKALERLLNLQPHILLLEKILITNSFSYVTTYQAYDEITTYEFHHNYNNLIKLFSQYDYKIEEQKNDSNSINFMLRK